MIAAIILAAGQSKRMGEPKMLLPWGAVTVIEHVVATFLQAGIQDVTVVTGAAREEVERTIGRYAVHCVHNERYQSGEMLSSLQRGLMAMPDPVEAVLVGLGDQPQVREDTVRRVVRAYGQSRALLVVPSHLRRRGHPWLVARPLWPQLLALDSPESPRDFLNRHAAEIHYVEVDTPTILADLDTPEDYRTARP